MYKEVLKMTHSAYREIILAHLDARNTSDCIQYDYTNHKPLYVIEMCKELLSAILKAGGTCALADVLRADTVASGHVDYVSKFALYCDELARGVFDKRA